MNKSNITNIMFDIGAAFCYLPSMATAICDSNHITYWRAQRGCTLSEVQCSKADCKAKLHAAMYTEQGWQRRVTKTKGQLGRKKANCVICGRSAFCDTRPSSIVTHLFWGVGYTHRMPVTIEANDPVCWRHSIFPCKSWFTCDSHVFNWLCT